jgi:hypothetical protein
MTECDSRIGELMNDKMRMAKEISQQKAQRQILKEALNSIGFAHEHEEGGELFVYDILRDQQQKQFYLQANLPRISLKEKQVLQMFYKGHHLSSMCSIAELQPDELFRVLQSLILPPSSQLPDAIEPTTEWRVCNSNLARVLRSAEFCFPARRWKNCISARTFRN